MCGLTGFLELSPNSDAVTLNEICERMTDTLYLRGPDDKGVWTEKESGLALGHRRLSIVDLSPLGHQPMVSSDERFVIAYNGEVYNFQELRIALEAEGIRFKGSSDTEVILEGCKQWGVEETAKRLVGMFAFALWDRRDRVLKLVRDRLGIKPLYWGRVKTAWVIGSTIKALKKHPDFSNTIDRSALAAYLRHGYVPTPNSIYEGIKKLRPGCIVTLSSSGDAVEKPYWTMTDVARHGQASGLDVSPSEAIEELNDLLRDAVARRMVADVPLGAFLSGGIDSSLVVALMQEQGTKPVKTFSIGFNDNAFNEAHHAKTVATHLGTHHNELYITDAHARDVVPQLPEMFDEPFADSSQIPTFLVSQFARSQVTVSLSGDGGDELFAGYDRYALAQNMRSKLAWMPAAMRFAAVKTIQALPPQVWSKLFNMLRSSESQFNAGDKLHKLATVICAGPDELYKNLVSHWHEPSLVARGAQEPNSVFNDKEISRWLQGDIERMQYVDTLTYLPDDILTKVDRASMAVSLEARVPLLDHRVVEFAWRLPMSLKIKDGQNKWLLRQVLHKYVPRELLDRPKMGFGVPIDAWLRGPLREWAESLLDEKRLLQEGYLNPKLVREKWQQHLSGTRNWHYPIWTVLMFQAWLEHNQQSSTALS